MRQSKNSFRHESLQDTKSIQEILRSVTKGIAKGKVSFSDEDGEIVLQPEGLLNLKLTVSQEETQNKLNIRISWQSQEPKRKKKKGTLKVRDSE